MQVARGPSQASPRDTFINWAVMKVRCLHQCRRRTRLGRHGPHPAGLHTPGYTFIDQTIMTCCFHQCRRRAGPGRHGPHPVGLHLSGSGPAGAAPAAGVCGAHRHRGQVGALVGDGLCRHGVCMHRCRPVYRMEPTRSVCACAAAAQHPSSCQAASSCAHHCLQVLFCPGVRALVRCSQHVQTPPGVLHNPSHACRFFSALATEPAGVRAAVQEATASLASAFRCTITRLSCLCV